MRIMPFTVNNNVQTPMFASRHEMQRIVMSVIAKNLLALLLLRVKRT